MIWNTDDQVARSLTNYNLLDAPTMPPRLPSMMSTTGFDEMGVQTDLQFVLENEVAETQTDLTLIELAELEYKAENRRAKVSPRGAKLSPLGAKVAHQTEPLWFKGPGSKELASIDSAEESAPSSRASSKELRP